MVKINIRDKNFGGEPSSCHKGINEHVEWEFGNTKVSKSCFITDLCLSDVSKATHVERKIAWLLEPDAIHPQIYSWIRSNNHLFDFVVTFDERLLERGQNYLYYPHGRCWINNYQHDAKTKMISTFASTKQFTEGHKLRFQAANRFEGKIDTYGRGFGNPVDNKEEGLSDYYFSVTIENCRQPGYWTEKIVDCFATKTIPLYWGAPHVGDFFNPDGIIWFENLDELQKILPTLTPEEYERRLPAIEENFKLVEKYRIPEDWMYLNYPWMFN